MAENQNTRGIARVLVDVNNDPIAVDADSASTAGAPGFPAMFVFRPFGPQSEAGTDGHWTPGAVDGDGALYVKIVGSVTTSSGSGDQSRPLLYYYGSSAQFLFPVFDDTEFQWPATSFGAGYVNLRNNSGAEVGTAGDPLVVTANGASPGAPARAALTTTSEQILIAAPGPGLSIYVTDMTGSNSGTLLTRLDLKEGAGGTIRYSYAMAQQGGGFAHSVRSEWKLPANTALVVQQSAAVNAYVTANYFVAA